MWNNIIQKEYQKTRIKRNITEFANSLQKSRRYKLFIRNQETWFGKLCPGKSIDRQNMHEKEFLQRSLIGVRRFDESCF